MHQRVSLEKAHPAKDQDEKKRRNQDRELRSEQLEIDQSFPGDWGGKKKRDFRLGELQRCPPGRYDPRHGDDREQDQCTKRREIGPQSGRQAGGCSGCVVMGGAPDAGTDYLSEEEKIKVASSHDRSEEVFRLLQPPDPFHQAILEGGELKIEKSAGHGKTGGGAEFSVSPVARKNTSSRLRFSPLEKRFLTSAIVPSAIFPPSFKMRT